MFGHTRTLQIEWGHCDPTGIVFNPRFFEFFDWNTALLLERALGMTKYEVLKKYGGAGIPLVKTSAKFLLPCRYGETVEITSTVGRLGTSSFDVEHRLTSRGALAVEGSETRVWTGRDADDPERIRAQPLPPDIAARFASAVIPEAAQPLSGTHTPQR